MKTLIELTAEMPIQFSETLILGIGVAIPTNIILAGPSTIWWVWKRWAL